MASPAVAAPPRKRLAAVSPAPPTDKLSQQADDAISRRRVQLERLKQQSQGSAFLAGSPPPRNPDFDMTPMLPGQPPPVRSAPPMRGGGRSSGPPVPMSAIAPPPMPQQSAIADFGPRKSDIFPGVPKSAPKAPAPATPENVAVRRLDETFAEKDAKSQTPRSKSAPPVRPPPSTPDCANPVHAEDPESTSHRPPPPSAPKSAVKPPPPSKPTSAPSSLNASSNHSHGSAPPKGPPPPTRPNQSAPNSPAPPKGPPPPTSSNHGKGPSPPSLTPSTSQSSFHTSSRPTSPGGSTDSPASKASVTSAPPKNGPPLKATPSTSPVMKGLPPPSGPPKPAAASGVPPPMMSPPPTNPPVMGAPPKSAMVQKQAAAGPPLSGASAPPITSTAPPGVTLFVPGGAPKPTTTEKPAGGTLPLTTTAHMNGSGYHHSPPPSANSSVQSPATRPKVATFAASPDLVVEAGPPPPVLSPVDNTKQVRVGSTPFPGKLHATPVENTPEGLPPSISSYYGQQTPYYGNGIEETPEDVSTRGGKPGSTPFPGMRNMHYDDTPDTTTEAYGISNVQTPALSSYYGNGSDADQLTPYANQAPAESHNGAGHTPFLNGSNRLDAFRGMVACAPTPDSLKSEQGRSVELRMESELARAEKEKAQALRMVAQLQTEIVELKQQHETEPEGSGDLYAFIQLLDAEGHTAAIEWAREQVHGSSHGRALVTSYSNSKGVTSPPPRRSAISMPKMNDELDVSHLTHATECLDYEFNSATASFTIRRPYGLAEEIDLWMAVGNLNTKQYARYSTVDDPNSIEIVSFISADNSYLVVYGDGFVRHQDSTGEWADYGNVYEREEGLGEKSYYDADGNEMTYSLDAVVEDATSLRVNYCSNVRSLAVGLKTSSLQKQLEAASLPPPTEKADANCGTEDLPFTPVESAPPAKVDTVVVDEGPSMLWALFSYVFCGIFSLFWAVFVRFPIAVVWRVSVHFCALFILATVHMYWKENYYSDVGSFPTFTWNAPGIR